ncbi:unnamed protein product, partial [Effrenium voratum]
RRQTDSPFAVASSERRAKLVGELRVAEELYQESCAQVAEMRAALKRMQLGRSVESMDVDGGGESISALRASSASQPVFQLHLGGTWRSGMERPVRAAAPVASAGGARGLGAAPALRRAPGVRIGGRGSRGPRRRGHGACGWVEPGIFPQGRAGGGARRSFSHFGRASGEDCGLFSIFCATFGRRPASHFDSGFLAH